MPSRSVKPAAAHYTQSNRQRQGSRTRSVMHLAHVAATARTDNLAVELKQQQHRGQRRRVEAGALGQGVEVCLLMTQGIKQTPKIGMALPAGRRRFRRDGR